MLEPLFPIARCLRFLDFRRDIKSLSALTMCQGVKVSVEFEVIAERKGLEIAPDREESFEENKRRLDAFLYEPPERDRKFKAMYRIYRLIGDWIEELRTDLYSFKEAEDAYVRRS